MRLRFCQSVIPGLIWRAFVITALIGPPSTWAAVFGSIRGVVHDPDHRPVPDARVMLKSTSSDYSQMLSTSSEGMFEATSIPVGAYRVTVGRDGFAPAVEDVVVSSG